jgi:hypothetical protein
MLSNKDGRHAWRPFQLIHPALYIALVDQMTQPANWKVIRARFKEFQNPPNFTCLSIPVEASSKFVDKAAQVRNWWLGIEQGSIELALDFNYVVHADITDCYADIYTHSIAWALHTKAVAKAKRGDKSLLGNVIDSHIQDMRHGQTNGIPQGSVLMDFIAELVLGYADLNLSMRLRSAGITKFKILRYRDDYRIFVQNPQRGEAILKCLTEVLIDLGLKLNTGKTTGSLQVVARVEVIKKIYRKLSQLPNTGHMEVWLQRISHSLEPELAYKEQLCQLVKNRAADIWNNDWITSTKLKAALDPAQIVSKSKLRSLKPVIKPIEIALFPESWY